MGLKPSPSPVDMSGSIENREAVCARLRFADGETAEVPVASGETLLAAVERQGHRLPNSCREGTCGACVGTLRGGDAKMSGRAIALSATDRAQGRILACQTEVQSDAEIDFDFGS